MNVNSKVLINKGGSTMDKNKQLLYCIFGSFILALLNSPMLEFARMELFWNVSRGSSFGKAIVLSSNIISLAGYILLAVFSSVLIIRNMKLIG